MKLDAVAKATQIPKKNFKNAEAAEGWFDSRSAVNGHCKDLQISFIT